MAPSSQIPVLVVADEAYVGQDSVADEIGDGFDVRVVSGIVETLEQLSARERPLVLLPHNLAPESGESVLARCARTDAPFLGLLLVDSPDLPDLSSVGPLPGVHAILPRPLTPQTLRVHLLAAGATRAALQQQHAQAAASPDVRTLVRHLRHEVRGQVQSMVGLAGMLGQFERAQLSDEGASWCKRLEASGGKLAGLVDDLVTWLRLGADPPEPSWIDVHALVEDIAYKTSRTRAQAAEIKATGPALKVFADRRAVETALQALIENALTYNNAESVVVTVSVSPEVAGNAHRVDVHDNGLGLPATELPRLFELFERHHYETAATPVSGGNGIGLALVKRAVERHGGDVVVTPSGAAATGTIVSMRFPDGHA